nr:MAG TPA: hypothetical protein [Bacteriophage sp.]
MHKSLSPSPGVEPKNRNTGIQNHHRLYESICRLNRSNQML